MMIHVAIAVVQIALESVTRLFLRVARLFSVVLVEAIAVVPRGAVRLPRATTHPAKFGATRLILANHVITSAILLDCDVTLGTLLGIGRYPIGCLRVVVALFYPLFEPFAFDWIVPQLTASKAEDVAARTLHTLVVKVLSFYGVGTIGRGTPSHQAIAFNKAVCN
jgi:hypothetical protein